jgi:hypothetical protein
MHAPHLEYRCDGIRRYRMLLLFLLVGFLPGILPLFGLFTHSSFCGSRARMQSCCCNSQFLISDIVDVFTAQSAAAAASAIACRCGLRCRRRRCCRRPSSAAALPTSRQDRPSLPHALRKTLQKCTQSSRQRCRDPSVLSRFAGRNFPEVCFKCMSYLGIRGVI